jgi:small subunit ribosomal protein S20
MPIIKSAKKRVRVSAKAAVRNSKTKRSLKTALKAFHKAITGGAKKEARELQSQAESNLDKAAKKGVMHKNKVARKKSQLARAAKAASAEVKPAAKKAVKTVAKKATVATKKPAAAKKPAAKKK